MLFIGTPSVLTFREFLRSLKVRRHSTKLLFAVESGEGVVCVCGCVCGVCMCVCVCVCTHTQATTPPKLCTGLSLHIFCFT